MIKIQLVKLDSELMTFRDNSNTEWRQVKIEYTTLRAIQIRKIIASPFPAILNTARYEKITEIERRSQREETNKHEMISFFIRETIIEYEESSYIFWISGHFDCQSSVFADVLE